MTVSKKAKKSAKQSKKPVKKVAASRKSASPKKTARKTKNHKHTKIVVHFDCGLPNALFIRGEGAGLSWHHGTPLKNLKSDEWAFEIHIPEEEFEFKVLVNDQVFEIGENHRVKAGEKIVYTPKFS